MVLPKPFADGATEAYFSGEGAWKEGRFVGTFGVGDTAKANRLTRRDSRDSPMDAHVARSVIRELCHYLLDTAILVAGPWVGNLAFGSLDSIGSVRTSGERRHVSS